MPYRFGPFRFDARNLRLSGPDGDIALRPMTLRLLHELLKDAPNLLGHEQLLDRVWGRQAVTPGVLSQSILELRRALGDSAQTPIYIETKHRLGYRFVATVEAHDDSAAATDAATATSPVMSSAPRAAAASRPLRGMAMAALVAVAALGAAAAWWGWRSGDALGRDRALHEAERVHEGRPREPQALAWYREGLRALDRQDETSAREWLEKSLRREPAAVATQAALADALARAGERPRALELARAAAVDASRLPREEQLRLQAFEAELDWRLDDAISHWQAVFALDPGHADSGFRLAAAQITGGRGDAAEPTLAALERLGPAFADPSRIALARARLATLRGDQKARLAQAKAALASAATDSRRIEAQLEIAWAATLTGDAETARRALESLDTALADTPASSLALRRDLLRATLDREGGRFDAAVAAFDAAATAADARGERAIAANARREAAYVLTAAGRHAEALARLRPLIEEHAALGDPRELASTLDVAGLAEQRAGDSAAAQALGERALALYVAAGDRLGEASARNQLGMLFARAGRFDDADDHWQKALAAFVQIGDRRGSAIVRGNLASVLARKGRADAAREANEQALADFRAVEAIPDIARIQFNLALQDRRAGQLVASEARMREALDGFTQMKATDFRLQAVASLAELLVLRVQIDAAQALLDSVPVDAQTPPQRLAALLTARARIASLRGERESAKAGFADARRLRSEAGLADWARMSELDLAELDAREGRLDEAEEAARRLRRELLAAGDVPAANQAGVLLASVLLARQQADAAGRLIDEIDAALAKHPDALLALRAELVRASAVGDGRSAALARLADRARDTGYEALALRAELLAGGDIGMAAEATLQRLGIAEAPRRALAF